MPVPMEEAKRFGIVVTDEDNRITDFQEKPDEPKSNLASMGIYIFNWEVLKKLPNYIPLPEYRSPRLSNFSLAIGRT